MRLYLFILFLSAISASAQVGYQVSLLDKSTGEPRVNEKVSVTVKITDSEGTVICEEQKNVTTDAFGVLSLIVGNSDTFDNVNWSNLPLSISATVDGILIGSSNILNVPIAEYARRTGELTDEILCSKIWKNTMTHCAHTLSFSNGYCTETYTYVGEDHPEIYNYKYYIDGNSVIGVPETDDYGIVLSYNPQLQALVGGSNRNYVFW